MYYFLVKFELYRLYRGSNNGVHVLLNLLNELRKRDQMLFFNEFNKFIPNYEHRVSRLAQQKSKRAKPSNL